MCFFQTPFENSIFFVSLQTCVLSPLHLEMTDGGKHLKLNISNLEVNYPQLSLRVGRWNLRPSHRKSDILPHISISDVIRIIPLSKIHQLIVRNECLLGPQNTSAIMFWLCEALDSQPQCLPDCRIFQNISKIWTNAHTNWRQICYTPSLLL